MKRILGFIIITFFLFSCQTRVVSTQKPLQANSLELYEHYTIITDTPKPYRVQILKQDEEKVYTKNKKGEEIVINKSDIREVRKTDYVSSIIITLAAIAAVIFVPI